jgi:hypothetical protein
MRPSLPPRRGPKVLLGQKVTRGPRQSRNQRLVQNRSLRRRTSRSPRLSAQRRCSMRPSLPRSTRRQHNMRLLRARKSRRKARPQTPARRGCDRMTSAVLQNSGNPSAARQKLIFVIWPPVPTSHPASGPAKATAQHPVTPGKTYQVVPSSGVHAAPPVSAVTTT